VGAEARDQAEVRVMKTAIPINTVAEPFIRAVLCAISIAGDCDGRLLLERAALRHHGLSRGSACARLR